MAFVKLLKTSSYYSRFQPKFRRRREGKTDYQARRGLIRQAKDKYGSLKYRFVVRKTATQIICQIVSSSIVGDTVVASANSRDLIEYGINFGLTNFAAAYATGLLAARRLLKYLNLADEFPPVDKVDGGEYQPSASDSGRRPFRCLLDVGITRTTTGNRVFAAMKGAVDGGLNIPHSVKRFPGYSTSDKSFDPAGLRSRIFGEHVANYMIALRDNDQEAYQRQFSQYIKQGIKPEDIENLYEAAHQKIRENPIKVKKEKPTVTRKRVGHTIVTPRATYVRRVKLTAAERKARVAAKIQKVMEAQNES